MLSAEDLYANALKLCGDGDYSTAADKLHSAIEQYLGSKKEDPTFLANIWLLLGVASMEITHYSESLDAFKESLRLVERTYGRSHPATVSVYVNLALLHMRQDKNYEAATLLGKAEQMCSSVRGADRLALADVLHNQGCIEDKAGRLQEAMALYSRSSMIRKKLLGDHPLLATTLVNMGQICRDQLKYSEAIEHHQRALSIREAALGPDHEDVAESCYCLACVYLSVNKVSLATKMCRRALDSRSARLPAADPRVREAARLSQHLEFLQGSSSRSKRGTPRPASATMITAAMRYGPAQMSTPVRTRSAGSHTTPARPRSAPRSRSLPTGSFSMRSRSQTGRPQTPSLQQTSAPVPFSVMVRRRDFRT
ncbi:hypothetical protein J8273_8211 [Carpediemonas membranifera]|uniref:Kinesin light chain n=1 Tax=Carpediemonas membranifera TaxID=201153 RepID=A0A8J6BUB3_9EUKA|nr:hypothetical protein J8273_8211 [Carpediemonas membranifera]|eukprot:KAG9390171.1 hypothetical protein J8273_8211 [Carpediemonas membranifera]